MENEALDSNIHKTLQLLTATIMLRLVVQKEKALKYLWELIILMKVAGGGKKC